MRPIHIIRSGMGPFRPVRRSWFRVGLGLIVRLALLLGALGVVAWHIAEAVLK